ncbi:MAG: asparagine synthase (glutamine-hydrolyzing) [Nitrospiria bacterium]
MCGIAGFFERSNTMGRDALQSVVRRMTDRLHHRGPDDGGTWVDPEIGIAFGHRRLSVIDLSPKGHQPMHSACGRYTLIYNGEIYNYRVLRDELSRLGEAFRGHSDTEVLLAAIRRWGLRAALKKLNGMFAFALFDQSERKLSLARDRFGEKPLYYGWSGDSFLFASELKSLTAHPHFQGEIHRGALALYLRHNYIPAPHSIYQDIFKLPPGSVLNLSLKGNKEMPMPAAYWSFRKTAEAGIRHVNDASASEATDELEGVLKEAVKCRMEADVPLGAFLSGGIDSSLIVALMQAQSTRPVKTFTIGFNEQGYNEAGEAKKIARHLGTDHTELYVRPEEALSVIPDLPKIYDEPFGDCSQIPTVLVSKLARQHVTVSLSGDGGDELFAGYSRYLTGSRIINAVQRFPLKTRHIFSQMLRSKSVPFFQSSAKIKRMADILRHHRPEEMYREMIMHISRASGAVLDTHEPEMIFSDADACLKTENLIRRMMYLDTLTYLPDDILVKVDRASMSVSLESRIPFLDPRVAACAWRIPISMHVKGGQGKWLLRKILGRYVPPALFQRPKMGFGIPIGDWLRGSLRAWAEDLLNEKRLETEGFFDPELIRQRWEDHLCARRHHHYFLWTVLMFQAWFDEKKCATPGGET